MRQEVTGHHKTTELCVGGCVWMCLLFSLCMCVFLELIGSDGEWV